MWNTIEDLKSIELDALHLNNWNRVIHKLRIHQQRFQNKN